ncbi:hypothetical protein CSB20_13375 [bacterium DOLZORAL124_64_63]|nr:MAG: hypothetical protein CSB20_13375 [bacterium DOLZORAL124_64_63]
MPILTRRNLNKLRLVALLPILLVLGACSSQKIVFPYPDEQVNLGVEGLRPPALYIDKVTDLRPPEQRAGQGHFMHIRFPKDSSWYRPVTEIYGQALVQDMEQTALAELVAYPEQAEYFLNVDIMSMSCTFDRDVWSFLMPSALGMGLGMLTSDDTSHRISTGVVLSLVALAAIPVPSQSAAEVRLRVTLKDLRGNIVWQENCVGDVGDRVYAAATARQDQQYVDRFLTKAVKRANACLLAQLRPLLLELGTR